jgi:adenylate cyclase
MMFTKIMRATKISVDVSVLFADLRGYTALSQSLPEGQIAALLDVFYDECAAAIWEYDGLLNKTIGDAIMAVFNFPIRQADHAARAVEAAREIHRRCRDQHRLMADSLDCDVEALGIGIGIGIGIDSGIVSFGEFGRSHRDLTAIGTVVNTAARAQSAAQAGQVLVTRAVRDRSGAALAASEGRLSALPSQGDHRACQTLRCVIDAAKPVPPAKGAKGFRRPLGIVAWSPMSLGEVDDRKGSNLPLLWREREAPESAHRCRSDVAAWVVS